MSREINIAILNEHWDARTEELLFAPSHGEWDRPNRFTREAASKVDLIDVLVGLPFAIFSSRSQARKAGWVPGWPPGWTDVTIGKRRLRVCVWNPVPTPEDLS